MLDGAKAHRRKVELFIKTVRDAGQPYLAAIRPQNRVLVLETMFFADAKKRNREIVVTEDPEQTSEKVVDLLSARLASVDAAKGHKPDNTHKVTPLKIRKSDAGSTSKSSTKSTAKKSAAKKNTANKARSSSSRREAL
jgi:hypothetical protein